MDGAESVGRGSCAEPVGNEGQWPPRSVVGRHEREDAATQREPAVVHPPGEPARGAGETAANAWPIGRQPFEAREYRPESVGA